MLKQNCRHLWAVKDKLLYQSSPDFQINRTGGGGGGDARRTFYGLKAFLVSLRCSSSKGPPQEAFEKKNMAGESAVKCCVRIVTP